MALREERPDAAAAAAFGVAFAGEDGFGSPVFLLTFAFFATGTGAEADSAVN